MGIRDAAEADAAVPGSAEASSGPAEASSVPAETAVPAEPTEPAKAEPSRSPDADPGAPRAASPRIAPPPPQAAAPQASASPRPRASVPLAAPRRTGFAVTRDGSYGACLADHGDGGWYPERWTLGGPEPYTVRLPGARPESPDAQVLPLPDGRVLIRRPGEGDRHDLALLYPTGPGTGELPVGFLHGEQVRLLPAAADGSAYALTHADGVSTVWLVHGGPGLAPIAEVPGRCTGGIWLDREGRTLALDRESDGRTKTVAVDLANGAVHPLLQITEDSDDRLLLADPDSGLLLMRSNAPGDDRLGWGVLGSTRPVRFPECLRDPGTVPLAVQPGQALTPEACAVALRIGQRAVLWRPSTRRLEPLPTPPGWLVDGAWWGDGDTLRLPYARPEQPYGVRDITLRADVRNVYAAASTEAKGDAGRSAPTPLAPAPPEARLEARPETPGPPSDAPSDTAPAPSDTLPAEPPDAPSDLAQDPASDPPANRVVPLQQAPMSTAEGPVLTAAEGPVRTNDSASPSRHDSATTTVTHASRTAGFSDHVHG
ncbi:hypothetical protein ABZ832_01000 [Streptantibioticus parmotrematis]|uniref:hypothetical protein n=1 Tax=Streptantibioticus parmotrematis TaxID=2873249 RepID=UPI0033CF2722